MRKKTIVFKAMNSEWEFVGKGERKAESERPWRSKQKREDSLR